MRSRMHSSVIALFLCSLCSKTPQKSCVILIPASTSSFSLERILSRSLCPLKPFVSRPPPDLRLTKPSDDDSVLVCQQDSL